MAANTEELISGILRGDDKLLEKLYVKNYKKVERYVLANNGSAADAQDIYQEAFLSLWRNIQEGRFIPEQAHSLDAYLFSIAKNKWTDYLRSANFRVKRLTTDESTMNHATESEIETDDTFEKSISKVKSAFVQLGENCRELLTQFYFQKHPLRQIASHFGWTEASAKNNKYRCLQKLRELSNNE